MRASSRDGRPFVDRVPTFDELNWPALVAFRALGGSASLAEHLAEVIRACAVTELVAGVSHGETGRTELEYRLAWARTTLKRCGYLQNSSRGVWSLTDVGEVASEGDVRAAIATVRLHDAQRRGATAQSTDASVDDVGQTSDWRDELLTVVRSIAPDAFERLCQRLLRESGFIKVEVTGRTGDGGIDGTGILQLSLMSFHVLFQCKRYQGSVGSAAVRDFRGAMMGRTDKGLIITTGSFSSDARREATRDGAPPIDLIDGSALCEHLKRLSLGITTELVEEVTICADWFQSL
ncbi:restriction endonuclease [Sphingomonas bacterium]|uniref:restriction endonuclease n=1 Tax=Sphingomonas bacterium TaxID=1895847 RepID=UPI001576A267|nr:restriction endonuclease [Sphingomonas bacterium]